MGGVYRIQTFIGFLYFFYIYKAPISSSFSSGVLLVPLFFQQKIILFFSDVLHDFLQQKCDGLFFNGI